MNVKQTALICLCLGVAAGYFAAELFRPRLTWWQKLLRVFRE